MADRCNGNYLDEPSVTFDFAMPAVVPWQAEKHQTPVRNVGNDEIGASAENVKESGVGQERVVTAPYSQHLLDTKTMADALVQLQTEFHNFKKIMREENEAIQKSNSEQAQELLKVLAEKKELEELVSKQQDEIGKLAVQKAEDDPKMKAEATKIKARDEAKVARYLNGFGVMTKIATRGKEAELLLVHPELEPDMDDTVTYCGLTAYLSEAEDLASKMKDSTFAKYVYAMCPLVFDRNVAVYYSYAGSTRNILQTLQLPRILSDGFTRLVAERGKDFGLKLPEKTVPARTNTKNVQQRQGIAKKILHLWLSKLRTKYRPSSGSNKNKKKRADQAGNTGSEVDADLADHVGDMESE